MLLVWGRRWYTSKLGYVAEFCEFCRRPQPFRLARRTLTGHFWYLPIGSQHAMDHRGRCTKCATDVQLEAARYASVAKRPASTRELLATTFPDFETLAAERMATEHLVRDNPAALTGDQRASLIIRPFVLLSPQVEERFALTRVDPISTAILAGTVLALPIAVELCKAFAPAQQDRAFGIWFLLFIAVFVWQFAVAKRNWLRRQIVPRILRSLAPLKPSRDEIDDVLTQLRQHKHQLGAKLKVKDFFPPKPEQLKRGGPVPERG